MTTSSSTVLDVRPPDEPANPTSGMLTTGYAYPSSTFMGAASNIRFGLAGEQPVAASLSVDEALLEWVDESYELAERFLPAVEVPEW
jgi:hypothetical protein